MLPISCWKEAIVKSIVQMPPPFESLPMLSHTFPPLQAKAKIMVVRDIERDEIEFISKTLNCLPISHVDHMKPEKLAHAQMVESESVRFAFYVMISRNASKEQ